ncbi:MAG: nicotinate phosphoribosyltransferase, partial [Clostridiales bacterium]|nr:nicotinate phosphoribosyltransferase [Clostridiales bacterium]
MERNLTLMTDLYQLTMMQGYFLHGEHEKLAVFDLFFRTNGEFNYVVAAGLETAVEYITRLKFTDSDIEYLASIGIFRKEFLAALKKFKFTGDVWAVEEGTLVFPSEPMLVIKAPIWQAQLIETALLNIINHQSLIASKASRIVNTAAPAAVLEFGLRRAQGPDAGIYGARSAVIAGCPSTSNVFTGKEFGTKISGTHSHSWVLSFPSEIDAFRAYAEIYPDNCLLLVDTYDALKHGVPNAITVFKELRALGHEPVGIRIDSGDLAYLSKAARKMLDDSGFTGAKICASNDIDENIILHLKAQGARIDIYGVGTRLITSDNMPALGGVYKMSAVEEDGKLVPKMKISDSVEKTTNPGQKGLYRIYDRNHKALADVITLFGEKLKKPLTLIHPTERWKTFTLEDYEARDLLVHVFHKGKLIYEQPALPEICGYHGKEMESFWDEYKRLITPHIYK